MSSARRQAARVLDTGPVLILAAIAGAGSFAHIRDTAAQHGQHGPMSWAIAICIDLTCVMAARERQRDKRTRRATRRISWPAIVLSGGVLLSLAANLDQAQPTTWGRITAATPAAAFLVAISMLERRTNHPPPEPAPGTVPAAVPVPSPAAVPVLVPGQNEPPAVPVPVPAQDEPSPGEPAAVPAPVAVPSPAPAAVPGQDEPPAVPRPGPDERAAEPAAVPAPVPGGPDGELLGFARRIAAEHHAAHGVPITRDALRARLGVSNALASALLRQLRTGTA